MSLPKTKSLNNILNIEAYASTKKILFKSTIKDDVTPETGVEIPVAIVYRLYHLGRAYDFQAIKLIKPQGSVLIPYIESQLLIAELEKLPDIVNDPVIECYLNILLPYFRSKREHTKHSFIVKEL